ncbi:hypothetical protein CYFUS_003340 [Cystobacter fuscus]|uniref:Uncharacterized protein n=1 Tax=Cystobacter fuscus TaxID=43 RepID=A0A250J1R3_9BACT|nr:hypothetical protein [Cystobacter fuscus]ATB37915.1 hypothetical protein CYFUS_003340 [Cystobacter fuscus]
MPSSDTLTRAAVVLCVVGLLLLLPILSSIRASFVGFYMLGSLLLLVSITLYVVAVVRELRRGGAL